MRMLRAIVTRIASVLYTDNPHGSLHCNVDQSRRDLFPMHTAYLS